MADAYYIAIEGVRQRITYGENDIPDGVDAFARMIQGSSDRVVPEDATFDLSSMSFEISNIDEMAELFSSQAYPAATVAGAQIDPGDAVIELTVSTYQVGQVFYMGSESMRVILATGTGTYQVVRGEYGTSAGTHAIGASVYTRVPQWRGRMIELYSKTGNTTQKRWAGFVESIRWSEDGTTIQVGARNLWTAALRTRVNRATPRSRSVEAVVRGNDGDELRPLLRGQISIDAGQDPGWTQTYVRFNDALIAVYRQGIGPDNTISTLIDSRPLLGSTLEEAAGLGVGARVTGSARPLFVVSPVADAEWEDEAEYALAQRRGDMIFTGYPSALGHLFSVFSYHPLAIAVYLLVGARLTGSVDSVSYTYDDSGYWSLFLRDIFTDEFVDSAIEMMQQDADLQVDHFILGWEDNEVDVLSVISQNLLRPFGYFFGVTAEGTPTIKRYRLPTVVDDFTDIEPLPSPWIGQVDMSLETAVEYVSATVGKLPWQDGVSIEVTARDGDANRTRLGDDGRWSLDYSSISVDKVVQVSEELIRLSVLGSFAHPRFRCRVNDPGVSNGLGLGDLVRIESIPVYESYLVNPDGNRTTPLIFGDDSRQPLSGEWLYGIITERAWNPERWTYDLTVLLTSYRTGLIRLRGGSALVTSVTPIGGDQYDLTYDADVFGTVTDEFEHAEVGDSMGLWSQSFVLFSGDVTYVSSSFEAVRVESPSYIPQEGDILRYSEPAQAYNLLYDNVDPETEFYKYG